MMSTRPLLGHPRPEALRYSLAGALTAAILFGGSSGTACAHPIDDQGQIRAELAKGHTDKAITLGEVEVAKVPHDGAVRALLGHAYLRAGRFESAATALSDAVALGDTSDRTLLSLALAQIACGQDHVALATLDHSQGAIPPADLGLALALAGDTERGIAVLTDSVRDGAGSAKLRQNLAYAYALNGRWADAQLTAGFDLPPDQVQTRLEQWAQSMQTGGERDRIARLLGVPLTVDLGMPAALALNGAGSAPMPELATAKTPEVATAKTDANGELQPLAPVALAAQNQAPAVPAAVVPVGSAPVVAVAAPVATPMVAVAAPAPMAMPMTAPVAAAPHLAVAAWSAPVRHHVSYKTRAPANFGMGGGHVVQLGAFTSAEGADRAKIILARRNPQLHGHSFQITQANVNGRKYWRVVTAGFSVASAAQTCSSLKRHGGACFAYAADHAPQGQALAMADTQRLFFADRRR